MMSCRISEANGTRSLHVITGLRRLVDRLEGDSAALVELDRFRERVKALERLESLDLDSQLQRADLGDDESILYRRAQALQTELEAANSRLYERIREAIRRGDGRDALLQWTLDSRHQAARQDQEHAPSDGDSYDYLDELATGVLQFTSPNTTVEWSAEMVPYQPTPARHIFELIRRAKLTENDVLIDLGSGLGHVPLLVAICTKARALGIDLEPSYVTCARQCAAALNLSNATFSNEDARHADLSAGTVFYLYTPFRGAILNQVLGRLKAQSETQAIRVCTFGPCTETVDSEPWLVRDFHRSSFVSIFQSKK
jgi:hypothetical protein